MKKAFLCILTVLLFSVSVFGAERRYNIDISDGKIFSSRGDFYFDVPISWINYIDVYRTTDSSKKYIERFDFYYLPRDAGNHRAFLMSLIVYDADDWKLNPNEEVLLKNDRYVISTVRVENNYYKTNTDKIIFDRFLSEIWTYEFLSSRIIGMGIPTTDSLSISVSGQNLNDKAILDNGTVYLPIRSVCNALNYTVSWDSNSSSVLINNYIKIGNLSSTTGDYGAKIINNRTFAPVYFFVTQLKLNIDLDINNNVKISD